VQKPTESERATKPGYNWFHNYSGRPEFSWDDCEVSQEEYLLYARQFAPLQASNAV
jgi:hypothetical protein